MNHTCTYMLGAEGGVSFGILCWALHGGSSLQNGDTVFKLKATWSALRAVTLGFAFQMGTRCPN